MNRLACVAASSWLLASGCAAAPMPPPPPDPPPPPIAADTWSVDVRPLDDDRPTITVAGEPPIEKSVEARRRAESMMEDQAEDEAASTPPPGSPTPASEGGGAFKRKGVRAAQNDRVESRVDAAALQRAVAAHRELFEPCLRASDISFELEATVAPSGKIVDAKCTRVVPDEPKSRDCMLEGFRRLDVGPTQMDGPARVRFAIALKRVSR